MDFLRVNALCFLYFITMSKFGIKLDTMENALVGAAVTLLFTGNEKEE